MKESRCLVMTCLMLSVWTASGRPAEAHVVPGKERVAIAYDDGEADAGYGADEGFFDAVMRFDLPRSPLRVDELSLCFSRTGEDENLEFDLLFFAADGPGGTPGTLLDLVPVSATGVAAGVGGTQFTYDLTAREIEIDTSVAYIGAGWETTVDEGFLLCGDRDGAVAQTVFFRREGGGWAELSVLDAAYRALLVRGVFSDAAPPTGCAAGETTLCLNGGRFRVEVDWRTRDGNSGRGRAVVLTADTGYFWFFSQANVELVVKVLDGCGINGRFWVFAGGLTDVEVEISVTDTVSGEIVVYRNSQGVAFEPIQDTRAFETCPGGASVAPIEIGY